MLKTTYKDGSNGRQAIFDYETKFIKKIELAKDLPHYKKIEEFAQTCLYNHTGCGLHAIRAIAYIDKINEMAESDFLKWAENLYTIKEQK